MYVLDTSAVKGIKRVDLVAAKRNGFDIAISPFTFYELLCHVDEEKAEGFVRQKGNVLKCAIPRLLPDPHAMYGVRVGELQRIKPTRFEDSFVIPQMLEAIQRSNSLEEFYETELQFLDGQKASCLDACERVRNDLEKEENWFLGRVDKLRSEITRVRPEASDMRITNAEFFEIQAEVTRYLAGRYEENGNADSDLKYKVFCSIFIFSSYQTARTIRYIENGIANHVGFNPERNDYEDGLIAFCLDICEQHTLVTNETGTIEAIERAIDAFNFRMKPDGLEANARVIDQHEFLREIEPETNF